jgi:hypothetical protein
LSDSGESEANMTKNSERDDRQRSSKTGFADVRDAELQANINKCKFFVHKIKYFDFIVKRDEIRMNFKKIEIILQ